MGTGLGESLIQSETRSRGASVDANAGRSIFDVGPDRRMVAGIRPAPDMPIDARRLQLLRQRLAEKDVVDPKASIGLPALPEIIPERVDRLVGMLLANGVRPPLLEQPRIRRAGRRLQQRVVRIRRLEGIDVVVR